MTIKIIRKLVQKTVTKCGVQIKVFVAWEPGMDSNI